MFIRKAALAAMLVVAIAPWPALGEATKMTGPDISTALTGNTVHGMWGETEYYSFFDANGDTIYTTKKGADKGTWRVTDTQYCSVWGTTEDCYNLHRDGDKIVWEVPASGQRYDTMLMEGKAEPKFE